MTKPTLACQLQPHSLPGEPSVFSPLLNCAWTFPQAPLYIAAEALMLEKIFPPARNKSQDASCDIVSINTGNSSLPWPELGNIFWQRNILLPKQQPSLYHSILFLLHCSEFSLNASNILTHHFIVAIPWQIPIFNRMQIRPVRPKLMTCYLAWCD